MNSEMLTDPHGDMALLRGDGGSGAGGRGEVHVVEVELSSSDAYEITPLLRVDAADVNASRMSVFSVSQSRKNATKEQASSAVDPEIAFLGHMISRMWSGSRYSGILCVVLSSIIYYIMDVLVDAFPVRSFPIYQALFARCMILLIISLVWLRRTGQPLIPTHAKKLLMLRSLAGFISLLSFIYSVQNLPMSYAVLLNFVTPLVASIGATIILQERLPLPQIGGLSCSILGLLIIFHPVLLLIGDSTITIQMDENLTRRGIFGIFYMLVGIFSTTLGGLSYCLIRVCAKAADQPVYTVISFAVLACPLSAICILIYKEVVLPNLFSFLLTIVLGILAFFAEICLARGLQLEKVAKATNILYIKEVKMPKASIKYIDLETMHDADLLRIPAVFILPASENFRTKVLLSQMTSMCLGAGPTPGKLIGCLFILASVCGTAFSGQEKEDE